MINLGQGKRSVSSVLTVFGRLIRSRGWTCWRPAQVEDQPRKTNNFMGSISWPLSSPLSPSTVWFPESPFFSPPAKCHSLLWLSHIWGPNDKRPETESEEKKKEGRGGLVPPLTTAAPLSPCSEVWLLQFSTGAALLPLLPPQNCLGPGVKVNGEKGEGEKKEWFPQSLSFRSSFLLLKAELEGFSWVSLYLFHNAYFCILTEWDQAGDTWGKKYS